MQFKFTRFLIKNNSINTKIYYPFTKELINRHYISSLRTITLYSTVDFKYYSIQLKISYWRQHGQPASIGFSESELSNDDIKLQYSSRYLVRRKSWKDLLVRLAGSEFNLLNLLTGCLRVIKLCWSSIEGWQFDELTLFPRPLSCYKYKWDYFILCFFDHNHDQIWLDRDQWFSFSTFIHFNAFTFLSALLAWSL